MEILCCEAVDDAVWKVVGKNAFGRCESSCKLTVEVPKDMTAPKFVVCFCFRFFIFLQIRPLSLNFNITNKLSHRPVERWLLIAPDWIRMKICILFGDHPTIVFSELRITGISELLYH